MWLTGAEMEAMYQDWEAEYQRAMKAMSRLDKTAHERHEEESDSEKDI